MSKASTAVLSAAVSGVTIVAGAVLAVGEKLASTSANVWCSLSEFSSMSLPNRSIDVSDEVSLL